MPCRCTGVKLNKCKCVLDTVYPLKRNESNVVLVARNGSFRLQNRVARRSIFYRLLESLYEKCAEYNLRYCPLRGFTKPGNQFGNTLKDLLVLACFVVANFVVFLTIMCKLLIHTYFVLKSSAYWLQRSLNAKMADGTPQLLPTGRHDYTPPGTGVRQ